MTRSYIFDPVALEEYHYAIIWYGEQSISAMEHFEAEVEQAIANICKSPAQYRKVYSNYRETNLKKFPYSIVFFLYEVTNIIVITSVYHHKRDPKRR